MASKSVARSMIGAGVMAAAKLTAAAVGGSSGMFAEGIRSAANCGNAALLALGQRRSRKPPDDLHPFGYGMELYFWSLVVATALFVLAGAASVLKGVLRVLDPQPLTAAWVTYGVLGLSAVMAGYSWWGAVREFQAKRGGRPAWEAVRKAKDTVVVTTLFDSSASLVGLLVAFLGVLLSQLLDAPVLDGVASVLIGVLMAGMAAGLVYLNKRLLIGASATAELKRAVRARVEADEAVARVDHLLTMHLSPEDVMVAAVVRFREGLAGADVGAAAERLARGVRAAHPEVTRVFVHPADPGPPAGHRPRDPDAAAAAHPRSSTPSAAASSR